MNLNGEGETLITELERRQIIEYIEQALAEMEESDEISQGAIDGLTDALAILGVTTDDTDDFDIPDEDYFETD